MQCLPDNLKDRVYYHPTEEGIEKRIKARLEEIRQQRNVFTTEARRTRRKANQNERNEKLTSKLKD